LTKRLPNIVDRIVVPLTLPLLITLLWEVVVRLGQIPPFILPSPIRVLPTMVEVFPDLLPHLRITLLEFAIGFSLALLLAIFIALLMDALPLAKKMVYPLLVVSQTVPIISVAPLFLIWFGYGILPKVLVVILVCFFPIGISLLEGLAAVDAELLKLLKAMGASRFQIYRLVKIPAALPALLAGLKISASYSIMGAIIGEWLGAMQGIGYYMNLAQHAFSVDRVLVAVLVITILSLAVFKIVCLLEKILMPWQTPEAWED
jgi:ABC-type nitrate/sulfonate/bicarbonate transport system permease component